MHRTTDLFLTAIAPAVWGTTYFVITELLPDGYPLTVAMLRALPAGLLLMLLVRQLPSGIWWGRTFVMGALNFSLFWWLLFIAAYRLPGGIAAIFGATSPLIVVFLARLILFVPIRMTSVIAAISGICAIAVLTLTHKASLDLYGILAGLAGAASMALGTVLTRRWQPPVSLLTFTAWQLTAGGLLLLPAAFLFEPSLPPLQLKNVTGFVYLGLIGGIVTYALWFRDIARLDTSVVATLGFLSPVTAVTVGWMVLGQSLGLWQIISIVVVIFSIWLGQQKPGAAKTVLAEKKYALAGQDLRP